MSYSLLRKWIKQRRQIIKQTTKENKKEAFQNYRISKKIFL